MDMELKKVSPRSTGIDVAVLNFWAWADTRLDFRHFKLAISVAIKTIKHVPQAVELLSLCHRCRDTAGPTRQLLDNPRRTM